MNLDLAVDHALACFAACGSSNPTTRQVAAMIALANGGHGRRRSEIVAAMGREPRGNQREPKIPRKSEGSGTTREPQRGFTKIALDDRAPADHNGISLSIGMDSVEGKPSTPPMPHEAQLVLGGVIPTAPKRPKKARPEPTPAQLAGWELRDAIAALVAPHLRGMTMSRWKQCFGSVAADMATAGVTADHAVRVWNDVFWRTSRPIIKLSTLAERIALDAAATQAGDPASFAPFWDPLTDELPKEAAS